MNTTTLRALATPAKRLTHLLEALQPLALLAARLYVAKVFFLSGLTKLRDWDTTLALFADEYHVPLLSPTLAAWLGTGAELLLPVLLVLGLGTRFAALGILAMTVIIQLTVPDGLVNFHLPWFAMALALLVYGGGTLSADRLLSALFTDRLKASARPAH